MHSPMLSNVHLLTFLVSNFEHFLPVGVHAIVDGHFSLLLHAKYTYLADSNIHRSCTATVDETLHSRILPTVTNEYEHSAVT
jgi:hypothetical protein